MQVWKLLAVAISTLGVSAAHAGSWQYGCVGSLPGGKRMTFDRGTLIMMPKRLAAGNSVGLEDGEIETFDAENVNSGVVGTMVFRHLWSDASSTELRLKLLSSKTVSDTTETVNCGAGKVRDIVRTRKDVKFELQTSDNPTPVKVELKCYDFLSTTCG